MMVMEILRILFHFKGCKYNYLLPLFIIFCFAKGLAQNNLVQNGDFESHREINLKESYSFANTDNINKLYNWSRLGFQVMYVNTKAPWIKSGWRVDSGYPKDLEPHSGKGMVQLCYEEAGPIDKDANGQRPLIGITGYLKAKLTKTLEIGKTYRLSMYVYVPHWELMDSAILDNIGICLLRKNIFMSTHNMLDFNRFFSQNLVCNQWQKMEFNIIPTCDLNYLVIGAFRTKTFPLLHRRYGDLYHDYFIDDVSCVELDSAAAMAQKTIYHCRENEEEEEKLSIDYFDSLVLNYKNNEYLLSEEQKKSISNYLIKFSKKYQAFKVIGHTDERGTDNKKLSMDRAYEVYQIISSQKAIDSNAIFYTGVGDKFPIAKDKQSVAQNRRTVIYPTNLNPLDVKYRKIISFYEPNVNKEKLILEWVNKSSLYSSILILFDPRINWENIKLNKDFLREQIINKYNTYEKYYLDSLYFEDQKYRTLDLYLNDCSGYLYQVDTGVYSIVIPLQNQLDLHDSICFRAAYKYFIKHGIPKLSKFGKRAQLAIIYPYLHSYNLTHLNSISDSLYTLCREGEADWINYAMVMDRISLKRDGYQIYGTQFLLKNNELDRPLPIEIINANRKKIALSPIKNISR